MKKLANVSPFLLLLFPVFMIVLVAVTFSVNTNPEKEIAIKTSSNPTTTMVKAATAILK